MSRTIRRYNRDPWFLHWIRYLHIQDPFKEYPWLKWKVICFGCCRGCRRWNPRYVKARTKTTQKYRSIQEGMSL